MYAIIYWVIFVCALIMPNCLATLLSFLIIRCYYISFLLLYGLEHLVYCQSASVKKQDDRIVHARKARILYVDLYLNL